MIVYAVHVGSWYVGVELGLGIEDVQSVRASSEVVSKPRKVARHLCRARTARSGDCSLGQS